MSPPSTRPSPVKSAEQGAFEGQLPQLPRRIPMSAPLTF